MKALHVIPSIGPLRGGPSVAIQTLVLGLTHRGVETHIATTDDNGPARLPAALGAPQLDQGVVYWHFPRQTRFYTCSLPMTKWLWRHMRDYDVVHIHALFSYPSTAAAWIARARGVPYIIRPLGVLNRWGMQRRRPLLKRLSFRLCEKKILERAAAVHYTSEQERQEAEELGFESRGVVIPNPLQPDNGARPAKGRFRARHPGLQGKLVYLFLSRVDEKKGLDLLLPAFARLKESFPQSALVIAGSGPAALMDSLRRLARALKLGDEVVWTGFLEGQAKAEALADADAFVLPSYSENFGVAVVEAMSRGLPVVVSDQVGIHPEIAARGAGLVIPCRVEPLTDAMTRLAQDPALRQEIGSRGVELASAEFSLESVCQSLIELYRGAARN